MRGNKVVPYVIVLAIVGFLYYRTGSIEFVAPGGRIGPNVWPRAILVLAMVACVYEIAKNLCFGKADRDLEGVLGSVLKEVPAAATTPEPEEKTYPHLLWSGIALTLLYVVGVEQVGFFLATFAYLAAFTWIGRYRRIGVVLVTSLLGSLALMFTFMKIVYVSLPLGVEPFAQVSFLLMRAMGIR